MTDQEYIGTELSLFAHARNWKAYYAGKIRPYIHRRVVEVGAGIAATTPALCSGREEQWVCLEPDPELRRSIDEKIAAGQLPGCCVSAGGFVAELPAGEQVDTFIYIDVLEHIQDDGAELRAAAKRLAPGGTLIVLSPAHQFLYSPFDRSIGHYRRYDKKMMRALTPAGMQLEQLFYLDAPGMMTSLANRAFLRQPLPTIQQIRMWDAYLVPIARLLDPLLGHSTGRSIIAVWRKIGS